MKPHLSVYAILAGNVSGEKKETQKNVSPERRMDFSISPIVTTTERREHSEPGRRKKYYHLPKSGDCLHKRPEDITLLEHDHVLSQKAIINARRRVGERYFTCCGYKSNQKEPSV